MLVPANNANANFNESLVLTKAECAIFFNRRLTSRNGLLVMADRNKFNSKQGFELP
jgi:hypothetical protein